MRTARPTKLGRSEGRSSRTEALSVVAEIDGPLLRGPFRCAPACRYSLVFPETRRIRARADFFWKVRILAGTGRTRETPPILLTQMNSRRFGGGSARVCRSAASLRGHWSASWEALEESGRPSDDSRYRARCVGPFRASRLPWSIRGLRAFPHINDVGLHEAVWIFRRGTFADKILNAFLHPGKTTDIQLAKLITKGKRGIRN